MQDKNSMYPSMFGTAFWYSLVIVALWINASEIVRYFVFIMPMMRDAFPQLNDVAPINGVVFASWMIWDTVLVLSVFGFVWIYLDRFGNGVKNSLVASTAIWMAIFVLLWLGLLNMNLTTFNVVLIAWPLSWFELAVAGAIINWIRERFGQTKSHVQQLV